MSSLSQGDQALVDSVPLWFNDPLQYVREAFEWGRGELLEHPGPDTWQEDVLRDLGAGTGNLAEALRLAVASGHGIGKSALVAWIILWAMSTRPHLAGVITANTGTQLETKTWRELAIWHKRSINAHWFQWTATKFAQVDHPETWFVSAIPWREEKSEAFAGLHGEHVLVIYDEASAIADKIWEVSEGAMTTPGAIWCAFGNPTRTEGRFREAFGNGKFAHRWISRQIDSRNARMANKVQIAEWVADYGEDSDFVRIRVRGVFPRAGSSQFIGTDLIDAARKRAVIDDDGEALIMSVDVARFGDDSSVIRWRRGKDARSILPQRYRGVDTMTLAAYVVEWAKKTNPTVTFIDGNGVGGGVVDRCRSLNLPVIEVQFGENAANERDYYNKRAECYALMRSWLAAGGCIDDDERLAGDLAAVQYGFDANNRIQLEKKSDMKKRGLASPDDGDTLAQTFAHPVARADVRAWRGAEVEQADEWDPFNAEAA
jgi:hypothetical protein